MRLAADLVLALHLAYVAFVVGGLAAIWVGYALGWAWVRKRWFRLLHCASIALVATEALLGAMCPLTVLEDMLRGGQPAHSGFVQRWLHAILYWDLPLWVFTVVYLAFAALVAATFVLLPPEPRAPARNA